MLIFVFLASASAFGDTYTVDAKIYAVSIVKPKTDILVDGMALEVGRLGQGTIVNQNGNVSSQWCRDTVAHGSDELIGAGGMCLIIDSDGGFLWIWFRRTNEAGVDERGVFNGSGKWRQATGGGVTLLVRQHPDVDTWHLERTGEIKR